MSPIDEIDMLIAYLNDHTNADFSFSPDELDLIIEALEQMKENHFG